MIPKFFTDNNEDRIEFVEFIQKNKHEIETALDNQEKELEVEGEKFKHPHNKNQKLADISAFSGKKTKFNHVKTTFRYFVDMNLGDDPVRGELLYELDDDEVRTDGFMENPERRKQIKEFEKWLNTGDVKKEFAKKTLKKTIKKHHIDMLKKNVSVLSARPMGTISEKDPGGRDYQRTLGKWENRSMAEHDKKKGGKKRSNKLKKTANKKGKLLRKTNKNKN